MIQRQGLQWQRNICDYNRSNVSTAVGWCLQQKVVISTEGLLLQQNECWYSRFVFTTQVLSLQGKGLS